LITNFLYVNMSQNQGDVQLNKKEGDEKKKAKSTWQEIECDGSIKKKKKNSKMPVYNQSSLRRSGRTCYFGPQLKAGAPTAVEDYPIEISDEGDD